MELLIPFFIAATILVWREIAHDRRSAKAAEDFAAERKEWAAERATLLNRIQAPEVEIAKNWEPEEAEMSLGFDDDAAFNAYRKELESL